MYIKKLIDPDGYDQYYDITVSDGVHDILCFGSWRIEKNSPFKLFCYFVGDMKKSMINEYAIEKQGISCYEYKIIAQVLDVKEGLLKVYGFEFFFEFFFEEELPNDLNNGDYLEFECLRMDCEPLHRSPDFDN
mgnify:CR=1 FL=1